MLTREEINTFPFTNVNVTDSVFFPENHILEIDGNYYFTILNGQFPNHGFRRVFRLYQTQNRFFLYDLESNVCKQLINVDIIKSHVRSFDGFELNKLFELDNGQIWRQIDTLTSRCNPGGKVWIKDKSVMKVGNWDFIVNVRRVR